MRSHTANQAAPVPAPLQGGIMPHKVCPKCHMSVPANAIECTTLGCPYVFVPKCGTHVNPTEGYARVGRTYPTGTVN